MTNYEQLRLALSTAMLRFDEKQRHTRGYNSHAFAIYLDRLNDVMDDISKGADVRAAIVAGYNGRLCNALLKACKLPAYTRDDATGSPIYTQVNRKEA